MSSPIALDDFPPYDGSMDIVLWKAKRKKALKVAENQRSKMLNAVDAEGSPLYRLTESGNLTRTKPLTAQRKAEVIARDGSCVWCGSSGPFEVDHIIRYIDGGSNEASNLQTLCKPCHQSKGGKAL